MKILVSNDDGYFAPGISLLAEALRQVGEVTVVAPERDRSGASNSLTLDRPLIVRRAPNGYFSVNGTPTIVVSRYTRGYRRTSSNAASYSGIPACASTAVRRGCRS